MSTPTTPTPPIKPLEHPEPITTSDELIAALRRHRFSHTSERELQAAVAGLLSTRLPIVEERRTSAGRLDIYVPSLRLAIELKTGGATNGVLRQLYRYAEDPDIDVLVLITSRRRQAAEMPEMLGSKPLHVVVLPFVV
jgi:hypothetical protein